MNQTVKIFFTDMDDTLLNSEKQVTKENMDAISEALAAGHKIVFNTGRPLSGFLPILKELDSTAKAAMPSHSTAD